jgi:fructose-bisphosphate aldolase class II
VLVNLNAILPQAAAKSYAVAGFNVFGFEDARAVIQAAEKLSTGVILMANRDSLAQIPVEHFGPMLARLAEAVRVPVCVHLDHTDKEADIIRAIKAGFSSVMFDGSQLPLEENIDRTRRVVEMAHAVDVTVEGEVGSVGYNEPNKMIETVLTDPKDAGAFAHRTGADAVAVAVGTQHRMTTQGARIDYDRVAAIAAKVDQPLVIHGTSGVTDTDLRRLATTRVAKFNIGTALRMAFGHSLRETIAERPEVFDRLELFRVPWTRLQAAAEEKLDLLGGTEE